MNNSLKEQFRKAVHSNGFFNVCAIDMDVFAKASCIDGCLEDRDKWIIYSTDEHCKPYNIKCYDNEKDAYSELANRIGFVF